MQKALPIDLMKKALALAAQGKGTVSPNPMVGCLIVKDDQILGEGFHYAAGHAHAEINALKMAGEKARGATAYVTLEPCRHHGRTPPCTLALIEAGIKKIYVATVDPNPKMSGQAIQDLKNHGIDVVLGLCEIKARALNEIFFHFMTYKRPYVIAKWAMSLDGKMIAHEQDHRQISGAQSMQSTHELRHTVDAILIGAKTAIKDDPLLTVRHLQNATPIRQPLRVIVGGRTPLPLHLNLFDSNQPGQTLVILPQRFDAAWHEQMQAKGIETWILPTADKTQVDLATLMVELGKKTITSLLVEGGETLLKTCFQHQLVHKVHVYLAPVIIAGLRNKHAVFNLSVEALPPDFHFIANYEDNHV